MISMERFLNMVYMDAVERGYYSYQVFNSTYVPDRQNDLPQIRFNLELLENPETGELYWVE